MFIMFLFTGCVSSPIDFSERESLPYDEGIILGRVKVIEGGEEKKLSMLGESKFRLVILRENSSKAIYVPLKGDGTFIWHLPSGRYTVASFEWHSSGILGGRIFASFKVLKNRATYIGTLTLWFSGARYTLLIADEYESLSVTFKDKFPEMKEEATKDLMKLEERR